MNRYIYLSPTFSGMAAVFLGGAAYFALDTLIPDSTRFFILTLLLLFYLYSEICRVRMLSNDRWLLNPAVLCSIMTFVLPFGIGNVVYLLPDENTILVGLSSFITPAMIKTMMLTLLAAAAMWTGYWSGFAVNLGCILSRAQLVMRLNSFRFAPKPHAIIVCLLVVLFVRLIMISFGIYGYSSDASSLAGTVSFRQYLTILELLGKFILIAMALHYFSSSAPDRLTKRLLVLIVIFEVSFGLLSGFKSAVALPVVLVGICDYYCTNKLNIKYVFIAVIMLMLAYAVIEPFRAARHGNKDFINTSLRSITNTLIESVREGVGPEPKSIFASNVSIPLAILSRTSMTYIASLGVEYEDDGKHSENAPEFLKDIFLSPLYAVIPRALWEGKELSRHGQWYLQEIMGFSENTTSAVGMSPITYLYFAGGSLAVFLGFFLIGIILRGFMESLLLHGGVVYLMMLPNLIAIDSVYYSFILETIRMILVLTIFFVFVYKRADISYAK